jgi:hypothetical protein
MDPTGTQAEEIVEEAQRRGFPQVVRGEYSRDGRHLLITAAGESLDIFRVSTGSASPIPLVQTAFDEYQSALSPDGQWVAFVSEESGGPQVSVQSFPDGQYRVQVSSEGGSEPQWRGDGRELYYIRGDRMLMAVPVHSGPRLVFGAASPLFQTRVPVLANAYRSQYAVTQDGQRFLVNNAPADVRPPAIQIVLDWRSLLPVNETGPARQ